MPISALLARIRKLIPRQKDGPYEEIVRGFGNGTLRAPVTPMSDWELGKAIAIVAGLKVALPVNRNHKLCDLAGLTFAQSGNTRSRAGVV